MPLSRTIFSFFFPAGVIVATAALVLRSDAAPALAAAHGLSLVVYAAALLLAGRFHSTRMIFGALVLAVADAALRYAGPDPSVARDLVAILVPANLIALAFVEERGIFSRPTAIATGTLAAELAVASLLCRPEVRAAGLLESGFLPPQVVQRFGVPQVALLTFAAGALFFLARFALLRNPVESGFFWTFLASFFAFSSPSPGIWIMVGGLVLGTAIVENSYLMAFHDQLTGLPARRAFYRMAATLTDIYALAIVDVDHFKKFNDTYGHETGDQVLRMVAARMARVTGGGKAFRWGGEEFVIVFPGSGCEEVAEHLELLRQLVEASSFILRGRDRRKRSAEDRGRASARAQEVWVTVSIGVAEGYNDLHKAMESADRALYAAKAAGRNRVEIAGLPAGAATRNSTKTKERNSRSGDRDVAPGSISTR